MGLRRIALMLLVVAALGTACAGDEETNSDASIGVEEPIGAAPGAGAAARDAGAPGGGASVAKSAFAAMQVPKDELGPSAEAVVDLATAPATGGFLVSSVFDSEKGHGSAHVIVNVPSDRFEPVVNKLDAIGEVTRQELEGQDITPQVLAAHARLQRARARAADLIRRLDGTDDDAAAFELREQLRAARARLRSAHQDSASIGSEVAFSTIEVALRATPPPPSPPQPVIDRAINTATSLTVAIASGALLIASVVLPIALLLFVLYVVGVVVFRRLKPRLQGWPE